MHRPLALVFYEKLLPGTQVVNRLHDLKYLVKVLCQMRIGWWITSRKHGLWS